MNNLDSFDNYIEQIFHDSSQLINNSKNLQSEIKTHKDIRPNSGHNLICLP